MTIVVAGADDADRAARSVASALAQTEPAAEVLLLGVTSAPGAFASEPRVRSLALPGATQGAQLQAALEQARGAYVQIVHAGDVLAPSLVEQLVAALEGDPPRGAAVCAPAYAAYDAAADVHGGVAPQEAGGPEQNAAAPRDGRPELLRTLLGGGSVPLGCLLLRRDAVLAAGGFDPTFTRCAGDDLLLRLLPRLEVRAVDDAALELGAPPDVDARTLAERGRALLRAFARFPTEDLLAASSDGRWRPPGEEYLELAALLAASPVADAAPLAQRVAREGLQHGAQPSAEASVEMLRSLASELARVGVPTPLQHGGSAPPQDDCLTDADRGASPVFPPRIVLAMWAAGGALPPGGDAVVARAAELRALGVDLLLLGRLADESLDAYAGDAVRVELLQAADSEDEITALFARCAVGVLLADPGAPIARLARESGVVVLDAVTLPGDLASTGVESLQRRIAVAAARQGAEAQRRAADARDALFVERAATSALRVAQDGMRDPGSVTGASAARVLWTDQQRHDIVEIAREVTVLAPLASAMRGRAQQVLDKLRFGYRFDQGVRALRRRLQGVVAPGEVVLEELVTETFLARAAAREEGWLWVVYATDPYSETRGQRSIWITQELSRRGHRVVYLYWRWHQTESIPSSGDPNVLIVPIDQLPALQPRLLKLRAPGVEKVLLIEFPDQALYERLNLFNAHGWTTVYDCVDEWEEFGRIGQAGWYDLDVERHLGRDSDVLVATHPLLAAKIGEMAGRAVPLVPNGAKLDSLRAPDVPRAPNPPTPVIGYFGHLTSSWFDWDLVRASAERNPSWRFEIYGYGQPEHLELPPNVVAPGMLPHEEISARTAHWSVGIVPFREGRLTQAVDPVKLYEYLALGMPVVAVGMPALRDIPGLLVCDRSGFDAAVRSALATPLDHERVAAFVAASSWQRRVDALLELIASADPERNVVKALAG